MAYKLNSDSEINLNITKFGLPLSVIEEFVFDNTMLFIYYLNERIGGEIYYLEHEGGRYFLKHFGKYIDVYGIHNIEDLFTRQIPYYYENGKEFRITPSYSEEFSDFNEFNSFLTKVKININEITKEYSLLKIEYTNFIIDFILKSEQFKTFNY